MTKKINAQSSGLKQLAGCAVLVAGLGLSAGAMACDFVEWSLTSGTPVANDPNNGVSRFQEFCGFEADGADLAQSNHPNNESNYSARFYMHDGMPDGGNVVVLRAASDESDVNNTVVFEVSFDGSNFTFSSGGNSDTVAADQGLWNYVEVEYTSGGQLNAWVNANRCTNENPKKIEPNYCDGETAPTLTINAGNGAVDAAQLGAPDGVNGGVLTFDSFASKRNVLIGKLLNCDANANDEVSVSDVVATVNEINGGALAAGTPDCNRNGAISVSDVVAMVNVING